MAIYLGARPGKILLIGEKQAIRLSLSTAILVQAALQGLLASDPATCQIAHLRLFREDDQIVLSDARSALFISLAGAANLAAELPRYIALASALACARKTPAAAARPVRFEAHRRPSGAKAN